MLRIFSNRLLLALLVALAAVAHLAASGVAAPLPLRSGVPSLVDAAPNAPAITSKAPGSEARPRLHEPKRFADAAPSGAAVPPAAPALSPGCGPATGAAAPGSCLVRSAVHSPGQRAPPHPLHTA